MTTCVHVFYEGMLYDTVDTQVSLPHYVIRLPNDVYQRCYLQTTRSDWYRSDGTPVLLSDVPKELLLLSLLLT